MRKLINQKSTLIQSNNGDCKWRRSRAFDKLLKRPFWLYGTTQVNSGCRWLACYAREKPVRIGQCQGFNQVNRDWSNEFHGWFHHIKESKSSLFLCIQFAAS